MLFWEDTELTSRSNMRYMLNYVGHMHSINTFILLYIHIYKYMHLHLESINIILLRTYIYLS